MFWVKVEHHCPAFLQFSACGYWVKTPVFYRESKSKSVMFEFPRNALRTGIDFSLFAPSLPDVTVTFELPCFPLFKTDKVPAWVLKQEIILVFSLWRWRFEESLPNMYSEPFWVSISDVLVISSTENMLRFTTLLHIVLSGTNTLFVGFFSTYISFLNSVWR